MRWEEVQARFPDQWLLIEVLVGRDEGARRVVDEVDVVDTFPDSAAAWRAYTRLRLETRGRELIPIHSSYPKLEFEVRQAFGLRARMLS
jgi:hypothetical protein